MRSREAEFLQTARSVAAVFFLERLQVFAEQVEAGRDPKIDHDHVCGLRQVIANRNGRSGGIALRQLRAVVDHIDGKGIDGRFSSHGVK